MLVMHKPDCRVHADSKESRAWTPKGTYLRAPEWQILGHVIGWQATADKANAQNTNFGVLSALLVGLSFPAFVSPPDFESLADAYGNMPSGLSASSVRPSSLRPTPDNALHLHGSTGT